MSKTVDILAKAFEKIDKMYGKGTIGKLGSMEGQDIEVTSSQSISLDIALGGGYPKGRMVEIYGPESSGKTTLAIHAIAQVQKEGGVAAIIDMEQAFDRVYAGNLGVNVGDLVFSQPDTGEQAWEILEILLDTGGIDILVVDSIAAMTPERELKGDMGDAVIGLQAKMMAQGLRKNVSRIKKSNCTVIFINQLRDNVGVVYGPAETTTGGKSMRFYASQRIECRRHEQIKDADDNVLANRTRVKIVKNKVAPPHRIAFFNIVFGKGIDRTTEILDYGEEMGYIKRSGSWFSYGETKLGQGKMNVKSLLDDNLELLAEIEKKVVYSINNNWEVMPE